MKFFFFLLLQVFLSECGHISVDDIALTYQNEGYIQGIHIYFSLESGLSKNEIIQISLPLALDPMIPYFIQTDLTSIFDIDTTGQQYYTNKIQFIGLLSYAQSGSSITFPVDQILTPNQWYHLVLLGSVTSTYTDTFSTQVQIATYSSINPNAILYDQNKMAGYLLIATSPLTLSFDISISQEGISHPSLSKTIISEEYYTYIDIITKGDYSFGGMIEVKLFGGFSFLGACQSVGKTCNNGSAPICKGIEEVKQAECRVKGKNGFDKLLFRHPGSIIANKTFRIKVQVKNPRFPVLSTHSILIQQLIKKLNKACKSCFIRMKQT